MLDPEFIKSFIASVAHGSFCGLHELLGAIGNRAPELSRGEVLAACRVAVSELIDRNFVRLHVTPAHAPRPTRDTCPRVPAEDASAVLACDASWESPRESRAIYWLSTTEDGEAAYISTEILSL